MINGEMRRLSNGLFGKKVMKVWVRAKVQKCNERSIWERNCPVHHRRNSSLYRKGLHKPV